MKIPNLKPKADKEVSPLAIRMAAAQIGLPLGSTGSDIVRYVRSELDTHPCLEDSLSANQRARIHAVALIQDHDLEPLMISDDYPTREKIYECTGFKNRTYFSRLNRAEKVLTATETLGLKAPHEIETLVLFSKYLPKNENGIVTLKQGIPPDFAKKVRESEHYEWNKAQVIKLTGGNVRTVSTKTLFTSLFSLLFDLEDLSPAERTERIEQALHLIIPQLPKNEKARATELLQYQKTKIKEKTPATPIIEKTENEIKQKIDDTVSPTVIIKKAKKARVQKNKKGSEQQLLWKETDTPSFISPPYYKDGLILFQFVGKGQAKGDRKEIARGLHFEPPSHRKTCLWTRVATLEEAPRIIRELIEKLKPKSANPCAPEVA